MIKHILFILISFFLGLHLFAQGQREITLEEIFYTPSFIPETVRGINFLKNGDYSVLERSFYGMPNIVQYEMSSGEVMDTIFRGRNLIPADQDRAISFIDYKLSSDERRILLATKHLRQYRYSFWAEYYVWDRDFKTLTPVTC